MPNPHPIELRERAVRAYEAGEGSLTEVSARFDIAKRALANWVKLFRDTGSVAPRAKRGGWKSTIDMQLLHDAVRDQPDSTVAELAYQYNRHVRRGERVHRSSIMRALKRAGYVYKKNGSAPRSKRGRTWSRNGRGSSGGRNA